MANFDDVWFTYKARIAAEVRLKNNDAHSQALLVWYAVVSSAAAIVALRYEKFAGPHTDIFTTILSVALLALSLFVANRDYRGRSLAMRANHIALKCFYEDLKIGNIAAAQKPALYAKLLSECENHTTYDDRYFRLFNPGHDREPTLWDWAFGLTVWFMRWTTILGLYGLPLIVGSFGRG